MKNNKQLKGRKAWHSRALARAALLLAGVALVVFGLSTRTDFWKTKPLDAEVVASVNGEAVVWSEVRRVQVDLVALSEQSDGEEFDLDSLQAKAIQSLIERRLLLQEAARRRIIISEDGFDVALIELRGRFPDLKSLGVWMTKRGLTDGTLIEAVKIDLLVKRVSETLIEEATVTEEQVREYYEANKKNVSIGSEVRLRVIAVGSQEAAEQVLRALQEGANFSTLARQVSVGSRAAEGGDTGWVNFHTLSPSLGQAVVKLKEGEAAGPIEVSSGEYLIVALVGRRPIPASSLDEGRLEIERRLSQSTKQTAVANWLAEQKENSKVEVFLDSDG